MTKIDIYNTEEFDKEFRCINAETLGCDSRGNIPVRVGEDEWEAEQCQYCFERLFKYREHIIKEKESLLKSIIEMVEEIGGKKEKCNCDCHTQKDVEYCVPCEDSHGKDEWDWINSPLCREITSSLQNLLKEHE